MTLQEYETLNGIFCQMMIAIRIDINEHFKRGHNHNYIALHNIMWCEHLRMLERQYEEVMDKRLDLIDRVAIGLCEDVDWGNVLDEEDGKQGGVTPD